MNSEYEIIEAQRWDEDWPDVWYEALDAADTGSWELLLDLRSRVAGAATAAADARRILDRLIAAALGDGGSIHDGQTFYRSSLDGALKVRDGEALLHWLAEDAGMAFNPNTARVGSVRMIAEGRGENPRAVEDTFFHRPGTESGEPDLSSRPLAHERTPKYAAEMDSFIPRHRKGTP